MTLRQTPFDSVVLAAVIDEISGLACGLTVQRVVQPSDTDVVLSLRGRGRDLHLLLSWDPVYARMHLVGRRGRASMEPPPFCMSLRKHLDGARLADASQVGGDRIARLTFVAGARRLRLIGEFMGRHSNLVLIDDDGVILACGKHVTHRINRHRQILPGLTYVPPPTPQSGTRQEVADARPASPTGELGADDLWLGPFAKDEIASQPQAADAITHRRWSPVMVVDHRGEVVGAYALPLSSVPEGEQRPVQSLSAALEQVFSGRVAARGLDDARRRLAGEIEAAIGARRRTYGEPGDTRKLRTEADRHSRSADLLLAAGPEPKIENGSAVVEDLYAGGAMVTIPIDPGSTPKETAERLYRLARRSRDRAEWLSRVQEQVGAEVTALEDARRRLSMADSAEEVERIGGELTRSRLLRGAPSESGTDVADQDIPAAGAGVRRIVTASGWTILVGRSSEGNDHLLRHIAAPNDIWLHVRGGTSAHVIVRTRGTVTPPIEVLRQAALLAARNSKAKHSGTVAVDYTLRKYVRRIKGGAPGSVTYRCEHTLHVDPRGEADQ